MPGKAKELCAVNSQGEQLLLCWSLLPPSPPGAAGKRRIPLVLGSSQPSPVLSALHVRPAPHVAHPRSQPTNGLALGSHHPLRQRQLLQLLRVERRSPEPWLLRAAGGRRGALDHQRRLPGPGATACGKPGSGGAAEGPPAVGRRGQGLGFPHAGKYLLLRSSPTPFHCPHTPRYRPPPGTVIALGTLAPTGAAGPGPATVRTNDSAPFVPRERFGQSGGGCGGREDEVRCCALTSVSRLQRYHPGGRGRVG